MIIPCYVTNKYKRPTQLVTLDVETTLTLSLCFFVDHAVNFMFFFCTFFIHTKSKRLLVSQSISMTSTSRQLHYMKLMLLIVIIKSFSDLAIFYNTTMSYIQWTLTYPDTSVPKWTVRIN